MPTLIDTDSRTGHLTRAVNDVLIDHGPAGLTVRTIARRSGVSPSSIYAQMGSREHLLRVAAATTCRDRLLALRAATAVQGPVGFLPRENEEILDVRVWLAWLEVWRSEDFVARWVVESRESERAILAELTDYEWHRTELDELLALVDGLRVAICAPSRPMRLEVAREIVAARCHTLPGPRVQPTPDRSRRIG